MASGCGELRHEYVSVCSVYLGGNYRYNVHRSYRNRCVCFVDYVESMISLIIATALNVGVPPNLLLSVCWVESRHRNVININDGGSASYGPCQVKLSTARLFNSNVHPSDLLRPKRSIEYAAKYLKHNISLHRNNVHRVAIAYNRGTSTKFCVYFDNIGLNCHSYYSKKVFEAFITKPWETK